MKHTHESGDEINPRSKFVIDLSVKEFAHSIEGPSVTRNATNQLEVIGSSILNPKEGYLYAGESSPQLISSVDNTRGVADVSRSARESFMRTISRLKHESKSSLAYLEQLQSNSEFNLSRLQRRKTSESEEMKSEDGESPEFQSSYFFPNSLKPITSLSNPNLSSREDPPAHPTYQLRLDSESDCTSEHLSSYRPSPNRERVDYRDKGNMGDCVFGGSQVVLNSLTPLGVSMRRMSSSFPDLSFSRSLGKTVEHSRTCRVIEQSQSDPFSIHCTDEDSSTYYPTIRRVQSSPKINSELNDTSLNHGWYSPRNKTQKECASEQEELLIDCTISNAKELIIRTSNDNSSEVIEFDNSTDHLFILEKGIQEQDSLVDSIELEEINSPEFSLVEDEAVLPNESEEQLNSQSPDLNVPERVRNFADPPVLTENEPDTAQAFNQRGTHMVKNMWDDFSFSKYIISTPKAKKPLRTTIPHPFSVYFKSLHPKKKSRTQVEGEVKRRLESEAEETECSRKFTARPVPNSTYQYNLSGDEKRQSRIDSRESLKSIVRPFKFDEREAEKRAQNKAKFLSQQQNPEKYRFKANPVPKHLFQSRYDDQVAEQDLYREIRKVMRTNQLLSASRLPSSMSESEQALAYTDGRRRQARKEENSRQAFLTAEHRFRPTVNKRMPDFKKQQELFEQKLSERKEAQRVTRVEFSEQALDFDDLNGSRIAVIYPSGREVLKVSSRTSQVKKRTCDPPRADGIYGYAPTKSTRLRQTLVNKRVIEQAQKERDESEREEQQRERVLKMKRQVSERVRKYDNREEMARRAEAKKRNFLESESSRKEEYSEHLRMIKERLDERPFVFERAPLEAAEKSRRFNSAASLAVRDEPVRLLEETFTKSYLVQPDVLSIS